MRCGLRKVGKHHETHLRMVQNAKKSIFGRATNLVHEITMRQVEARKSPEHGDQVGHTLKVRPSALNSSKFLECTV